MICGMIRPEGTSRPVGTAMQTKPGTDVICEMIRPEGMSRPVGTAMQTEPGTGMICNTIRSEGISSPEGTAMQTKFGTAMSRLDNNDEVVWVGAASFRATRASFSSRPRAL
jgi:hypothetical protein